MMRAELVKGQEYAYSQSKYRTTLRVRYEGEVLVDRRNRYQRVVTRRQGLRFSVLNAKSGEVEQIRNETFRTAETKPELSSDALVPRILHLENARFIRCTWAEQVERDRIAAEEQAQHKARARALRERKVILVAELNRLLRTEDQPFGWSDSQVVLTLDQADRLLHMVER